MKKAILPFVIAIVVISVGLAVLLLIRNIASHEESKPDDRIEAKGELVPVLTDAHEETGLPDESEPVSPQEVNIDFVTDLIGKTKGEIVQKLGKDYKVQMAGPEGAYDAYHYDRLGIGAIFIPGEKTTEWIYCLSNVDVRGANSGMNLTEIREILGQKEVKEVTYRPEDVVDVTEWYVEYLINDCIVRFTSNSEDGRNRGSDLELDVFAKGFFNR